MAAATDFIPPPHAPDPSPGTCTATEGEEALSEFAERGVSMAQSDKVCICMLCAGFLVLPRGVPRALKDRCLGPSKVPSTRDKQLRKLAKAEKSLHPSTAKPLDKARLISAVLLRPAFVCPSWLRHASDLPVI